MQGGNSLSSFEDHQFNPGESGNPKGRPKGGYLTDILKRQGDIVDQEIEDGSKISRKEAIAEKLWEIAISGDDAVLLKYLYDRIDGKPLQAVEADIKSTGFQINVIEPPESE